MPRPTERPTAYVPGLDGVRALAVAAVVGYHLGVPSLSGGLLGVGVFFTLSGFLITGVLVSGWERTRTVGLRRFYVHRARRLLPAVVVLLVVVSFVSVVTQPEHAGERLAESVAALLYVSNWKTITDGESYFQRFSGPGPFDHLWSLAVEEQFYVVWPVLLLALVVLVRGRLRGAATLTTALAVASFVLLWLLAVPGFDNTRAYEGTDARAGGLLVGAAVALVWRRGSLPPLDDRRGRRALDGVGLACLVVVLALMTLTDEYSLTLYRGGLLLLSLATAGLVAVVSHPRSRLGRLLGVAPLRWVGERSYGIYLWHLPVVALTGPAVLSGHDAARGALQLGLTLLLATLSWNLVEDPIRRRGFRRALRPRRPQPGDLPRAVPSMPVVAAGTIALAIVAVTSLSAAALVGRGGTDDARADPGDPPVPPATAATSTPSASSSTSSAASSAASSTATPPTAAPTRTPSRTSCTSLVHVGDSTSVGLVDPAYQPRAATRLPAQYARVGVTSFVPDILGARSIVETFRGQPNAESAVTSRTTQGYAGCWVLAMGTNEVANQYVGGVVPLADRIDRLMRPIGNHPVLWLTVRTTDTSGPYADREMEKWNAALLEACTRYPNLRVYDWRAEVRRSWFVDDGIHFTTKGYVERGRRVADALVRAFPATGQPAQECLVRSGD
ncbi:acyltransferase family protein [Terrabacter sp. LjRoot27]|uniref:acyltransferase family protein n=1 Tax=Terrabacter sp. LjRoot27 TaxID=3342306 RepID=UPI003ECF26C2